MATLKDLQELFADKTSDKIASISYSISGFRTTKMEELMQIEINQLWQIHAPKEKSLDAEFNALKYQMICKEWRSNILAKAEKLGIKEKGDFHTFNNFMMLKSKFKKQLTAHNLEELKLLHQQFCAFESNNKKSAQKPMTEAWWKKGKDLMNYN